jgi:hypothetical protein
VCAGAVPGPAGFGRSELPAALRPCPFGSAPDARCPERCPEPQSVREAHQKCLILLIPFYS